MGFNCGIVGLPNVGKSTLFNALTATMAAEAVNYPFCTIEPNIGVVNVPDERLDILGKIDNSAKIVPAQLEFVDIAGLVRGASKGEGLGNQFLGNIREVVDSAGVVEQVTNYYPFGTPYTQSAAVMKANTQPYKFNGKELDRMHGLDTYDYGARQYDPVLGRWDRMDPLCEKYYDVSPYVYCGGNPVRYVDPDGDKIVDAKKETKKSDTSVNYKGESVNIDVSTTYLNAISYTGKKIDPAEYLKAKSDKTTIAKAFTPNEKVVDELLSVSYVCTKKTAGDASFYAKVVISKEAKKNLSSAELKTLKKMVSLMNL